MPDATVETTNFPQRAILPYTFYKWQIVAKYKYSLILQQIQDKLRLTRSVSSDVRMGECKLKDRF